MSEADQWLRPAPLTPEELAAVREKQLKHQEKYGYKIDKFTCDNCPTAPICMLVFDCYNTDGDCLLEK